MRVFSATARATISTHQHSSTKAVKVQKALYHHDCTNQNHLSSYHYCLYLVYTERIRIHKSRIAATKKYNSGKANYLAERTNRRIGWR